MSCGQVGGGVKVGVQVGGQGLGGVKVWSQGQGSRLWGQDHDR